MSSFGTKFKRFVGNKNTVTILCVVAGLIVLYVGYNYRVKSAIDPEMLPYAKVNLEARHVITAEDIGYMDVNRAVIKKSSNVVKNANDLIGKEVMYGNEIQAGSLFYTDDFTDPKLGPDYVLNDIADGHTAFSLSVNPLATYGNNIAIGSFIDLFFKGEDDYGKFIYTNFVKSIQVLDVRDSKGVSLANSKSDKPAELLFSVPDSLYSLLVKADKVGELVPIRRDGSYTAEPGETEVSSSYVRSYVLSKFATIPDEDMPSSFIEDEDLDLAE